MAGLAPAGTIPQNRIYVLFYSMAKFRFSPLTTNKLYRRNLFGAAEISLVGDRLTDCGGDPKGAAAPFFRGEFMERFPMIKKWLPGLDVGFDELEDASYIIPRDLEAELAKGKTVYGALNGVGWFLGRDQHIRGDYEALLIGNQLCEKIDTADGLLTEFMDLADSAHEESYLEWRKRHDSITNRVTKYLHQKMLEQGRKISK